MSLLKGRVIGSGAAGNKAAITLIEEGVVDMQDVLLVNSTIKDIPEKYHNISVVLSEDSSEGCGKERDRAQKLIARAIQSSRLDLDGFVGRDTDLTILIGSTAGGTGSGSVPIMASYIRNFIDTTDDYDEDDDEYFRANVHVIGLKGFGIDGREYQNTIEFFKDIEENFTVECIDNSKFLDEARNSRPTAEKLANQEVVRRVRTLLGLNYVNSEQNIDKKDQYKAVTIPGFMTVEHFDILDKIKNVQEFNDICVSIVDETKSLTTTPTQKRLAVILNIPKACEQYIDYDFAIFKERLGFPYEVFTQLQFCEDTKQEAYIEIISSGLQMPIEELERLYEEYKVASSKVNKSQDGFYDFMKKIQGNAEDGMFNSDVANAKPKKDKAAFLNSLAGKSKSKNVTTEQVKKENNKDTNKTDKSNKF